MCQESLSIITVHYNAPTDLAGLLRSLEGDDAVAAGQVVVVDNGSDDQDRVRSLLDGYPWVKAVYNQKNLGLARAANQALRLTSGEFVVHLNPDIVVLPGALARMRELLVRHRNIGLVFAKLTDATGRLQYSCRRFYDLRTVLCRRTSWAGRLWPKVESNHLMADWDHNTMREIDWAQGAAFMARRAALPQGRLFDERFFLYFEDVDLCLAMRRSNWGVVYLPEATMIHAHQRASFGRGINRATWEHLKSLIKFSMKYHGLKVEEKSRT
ncbi:MAG: glycosyltransferase family 2 protein [Deltaproteobacteria bacterium]|nr:glycosyltransferase family 2 protein [Deltaproteobacteria bacterium]